MFRDFEIHKNFKTSALAFTNVRPKWIMCVNVGIKYYYIVGQN